MIPCKECCNETRVIGVTYGYISADDPYVRRRHECKVCKKRFSTVEKVAPEPDPHESKRLARELKDKLQCFSITQDAFAQRMDVSERTVKRWVDEIPSNRVVDVRNFLLEGKTFRKK